MFRPRDQGTTWSLRLQRYWGRSGARRTGPFHPGWWTREKLLAAGLLVFLLFFTFSRQGILDLWSFKKEQWDLDRRIAVLKEQNAEMERKILALKKHDVEVERIARERLDMVRDNEFLYKFSRKP